MSTTETEFESFDYTRLAQCPELQEVSRALNNLAQCLDRGDIDLPQSEFEQMAALMARHLVAADCCDQCAFVEDDEELPPVVRVPR
jgi:hypothetical protein